MIDRKTVTIERRLLVALIIGLFVTAVTYIWSLQRVSEHSNWQSQYGEVQVFWMHLQSASILVHRNVTSTTIQGWLGDELLYASWTLSNLGNLDSHHSGQLFRISTVLLTIRSDIYLGTYIIGFNSTQLDRLSTNFQSLGDKLRAAYTNFLNYTSTSNTGPSFWYFGPTPPDEILLRLAVDLAVTMPGLPPVPS